MWGIPIRVVRSGVTKSQVADREIRGLEESLLEEGSKNISSSENREKTEDDYFVGRGRKISQVASFKKLKSGGSAT